MENQEFLHRKTRKEIENKLSTLSISDRASYLAKQHKKCIKVAQKHKLNIYSIKNKDEGYEQKL